MTKKIYNKKKYAFVIVLSFIFNQISQTFLIFFYFFLILFFFSFFFSFILIIFIVNYLYNQTIYKITNLRRESNELTSK